MSIVTKTGDQGTTALLYNRRVSKCEPRVEACGEVDELNAALGLARATVPAPTVNDQLQAVQKDLIALMGELATAPQDAARYRKDGFARVGPAMTARLEGWVREVEAEQIQFRDWALPGGNPHSAALDLARAVCRRAERRVCVLQDRGQLQNPEILIFLNRLSDLLWLWGRRADPPK